MEVRLVPDDENLRIELFGELAALNNFTNELPRSYGDPRQRDRILVEQDLLEGFIGKETAADEYRL